MRGLADIRGRGILPGDVTVGDAGGETMLADIALGDNRPCNSNARRGDVAWEMMHYAMLMSKGEMSMGSCISGD